MYFYMRYEHDSRPFGKRHFVTYKISLKAASEIFCSIRGYSREQEPGTVSHDQNKLQPGTTHDGGSRWDVDLHKVLTVVPWQISREESGILRNAIQSSKSWTVSIDDDAVSTGLLDTDPVVGKAVAWVKVEDPEKSGALKHNDLVLLVLEGDVGLWSVEPTILLFCPLHLAVEVVQEAVSQQVVVWEVELTASIVEAVAVALAWKVEPLWVTEFVALKIKITLATESVGNQTNHLMQTHTALDDWRELAES